jgi:hypothetical protein
LDVSLYEHFCASGRKIMRDEDATKFAEDLRGDLIGRASPEYDEARKLYNGMIDKQPLFTARCVDVLWLRPCSRGQLQQQRASKRRWFSGIGRLFSLS